MALNSLTALPFPNLLTLFIPILTRKSFNCYRLVYYLKNCFYESRIKRLYKGVIDWRSQEGVCLWSFWNDVGLRARDRGVDKGWRGCYLPYYNVDCFELFAFGLYFIIFNLVSILFYFLIFFALTIAFIDLRRAN